MSECGAQGSAFVQCRINDALFGSGSCSACPDVDGDILTNLPNLIYKDFLTTPLAPTDPGFCDAAQKNMCAADTYDSNTCCCKTEYDAWQVCLVQKDASPMAVLLPEPCSGICGPPPPPPSECLSQGQKY
eukprot:jgi/Psemu1/56032/gm1.56032_g